MKKLMIAALAVTAVGGAFAAPLVYDYKASVKHMYEKEQKVNNVTYYVKYVKTSKLQGYFVQDVDSASLLSKTELAGAANSEKKGFLVLINKAAEKNYRAPKIMPAQLDVKIVGTKVDKNGNISGSIAEGYFYAGPFAAFLDATNEWDSDYDDGKDYMVNNGVANGAAGVRAYGTAGSTIYLFGQHNTYNRWANTGLEPAGSTGIYAFGDAWMNGAGFGTTGTAVAGLCCGWETKAGGSSVKSLSGNLKGGLFLCSIGGYIANVEWFALGLEDLYKSDNGNALGKAVQGDLVAAEDPEDEVTWADGDIALSTTDVVSGSWTLKPAASSFKAVALDATEQAFFTNYANPGMAGLLQTIKGASQALDKQYKLTTAVEPRDLAGKVTEGLISPDFQTLYL